MRTIKFRAWDTLKSRIVEVCGIDFSNGLPSVIHTKALSPEVEVIKSDTMVGNRYILMQFTGLLDRHGNEIYEGDILKITDIAFRYEYIGVINWVQKDLGYFIGIQKKYETMPQGLQYPMILKEFHWLEIIGNIYENQELLK